MTHIRVGDLCQPDNKLLSKRLLVSDEDLLDVLFEVDLECLLVVTSQVEMSSQRARAISLICNSSRIVNTGKHAIYRVLTSSGPYAGRGGCVPSFWLRTVVR